jgi:CPA1 family monovalent cation:H+ antiporter
MRNFINVADRDPGMKAPILMSWTGMRGVVSLAAALSIPVVMENGQPFPHRDLILFITFIVILATLIIQGLTLPALIKNSIYPILEGDICLKKNQNTFYEEKCAGCLQVSG